MESKKKTEKIKPEELLSRFRSKEDLYRYMTQQVNVFLPTMHGTKVSFLRDILSDAKLHLKRNEVFSFEVPPYNELSVKNLYDDAMQDPLLSTYLPSKEQLSGKLPERHFFFGVLCTLKQQYMRDIIEDAQKKRFKVPEEDQQKQGILVSESWMEELMKHPYHSKKPGTAIFLMKEHAKLYKVHKPHKQHSLLKRLSDGGAAAAKEEFKEGEGNKRMNLGDGKFKMTGSLQMPK